MEPAARGVKERMQGTPLEANPYATDSDAWREWRRGWLVSSESGRLRRIVSTTAEPTPVSSPIEL